MEVLGCFKFHGRKETADLESWKRTTARRDKKKKRKKGDGSRAETRLCLNVTKLFFRKEEKEEKEDKSNSDAAHADQKNKTKRMCDVALQQMLACHTGSFS